MKRVHNRVLLDWELRPQLQAKDTILFDGPGISWQTIERQVERLGFGDFYIVTTAKAARAGKSPQARISLHPN